MLKGSCLCGSIRFTVSQPFESPTACHCEQCRKQSGHIFVAETGDCDTIGDGLPQNER